MFIVSPFLEASRYKEHRKRKIIEQFIGVFLNPVKNGRQAVKDGQLVNCNKPPFWPGMLPKTFQSVIIFIESIIYLSNNLSQDGSLPLKNESCPVLPRFQNYEKHFHHP